jgi:hypothetical protein
VRTLVAGLVALVACGYAWAAPSPSASKSLPEQASERAQPQAKTTAVVPPTPITLPPPPNIPEIVASFTTGQTTQTAAQTAAAAAVAQATTSATVRLRDAVSVSIITMTGTQRATRVTRLRPLGRAGDLEIVRWTFADRFGRRIGEGNTLCRWASVARRLCWGEIRLPRGRLVMLGSSQTRALGEFAVIGGTGVYTFKQGLMAFRQLSLRKYAVRVLLA